MSSIRHHPVNDDWIRFNPTKTVKRNHHWLTHRPRAKLIKTKVPAIPRIYLSIVITDSPFCSEAVFQIGVHVGVILELTEKGVRFFALENVPAPIVKHRSAKGG